MANNLNDLTLVLVQFDIEWQNPTANKKTIEIEINKLEPKVDLIVLPEMFTTGFTMDVKPNAENANGGTLEWMKNLASSFNATITGSIIINENNKYYNRLYWVKPTGEVNHYNKRHLFRMAEEDESFTQGNESPIFEVNGWNVKPLICYDLRFPVWARNTELAYDLVLYVANWPKPRISAWDTLLKARAIENLSFSAGVNRTGKDGANINYNGHSAAYNFKGEKLNKETEKQKSIIVTLSKTDLINFRKAFPANLDADNFNIR